MTRRHASSPRHGAHAGANGNALLMQLLVGLGDDGRVGRGVAREQLDDGGVALVRRDVDWRVARDRAQVDVELRVAQQDAHRLNMAVPRREMERRPPEARNVRVVAALGIGQSWLRRAFVVS